MKKILSLFVALIATTALWASNVITYTATSKLPETTSTNYYTSGLRVNAFNVAVTDHTFSNGHGTITFAGEVVTIGNYAFYGCTALTSITIPNSVTSIGDYAFDGCSSLPVENNIRYADTYLVGATNRSLSTYTIKSGTKWIGYQAFSGCSNLSSITIPNSVTSIGGRAFDGCYSLTSITIPNNVTSIGYEAFFDCRSLTSITIPNNVTSIGYNAFRSCTSFTSITIPNNVTSIGGSAFANCTALKYFEVKNHSANCEEFIVSSCSSIDTIIGPASLYNFSPSSMVYIDDQPYTASYIQVTGGELEETGCLTITRSYKRLKTLDASAATNTTLADEAFKGCYNVETLKLPSQLEYVPYMAVAGCKNLKSIDIPASVIEIDQSAFEDCRSLETITFGGAAKSPARMMIDAKSALKKIGNWAFYNAHELQNLTIPEGVEEIGDGAFYGCTYLEDLVLPSSTRMIGDNCFALCSKLKKITITSMTPPTIYAKTFYDVNRTIPVYVPDEAVDSYKGDTYWKEFDIRGGATGIVNVNENVNVNRKLIRDGQLLIIRDGKMYNAQGGEL